MSRPTANAPAVMFTTLAIQVYPRGTATLLPSVTPSEFLHPLCMPRCPLLVVGIASANFTAHVACMGLPPSPMIITADFPAAALPLSALALIMLSRAPVSAFRVRTSVRPPGIGYENRLPPPRPSHTRRIPRVARCVPRRGPGRSVGMISRCRFPRRLPVLPRFSVPIPVAAIIRSAPAAAACSPSRRARSSRSNDR